MGIVFFSRAVAAMNCVYTMYLTDISIYCYFKVALAAIHLRGSIIMSGGHLQGSSILKCTVFFWSK